MYIYLIGLATLTLWAKQPAISWLLCLGSFLLCFLSHQLEPTAAILYLLLVGFIFLCNFKHKAHLIFAGSSFLLASSFFFGFIPGIDPLYAKMVAAFTVLSTNKDFLSSKTWALPLVLSSVSACILTLLFQRIYDVSFPMFLFSGVIPQEAILRLLLQKEIFQKNRSAKGAIFATLIASAVYLLFNLDWQQNFDLLLPLFTTGVITAIIYQMTHAIEAPILCQIQFYLFSWAFSV